MYCTKDVLRALARANPDADVTEDKIRRILRRGLIPTIRSVAGRLLWSRDEIETLAKLLDLRPPEIDVVNVAPLSSS